MDEELIKYIGKVFIVVVILFGLILTFNIYDSKNPTTTTTTKQLKEVVTIETMKIPDNSKIDLQMDSATSFCQNHEYLPSGSILEKSCDGLTNENCKSVSCCVLLNGEKCVAGGASGPTFKTEKNGSKRSVDYYYYQQKCYGSKCSS
jgi:hypothetical protein